MVSRSKAEHLRLGTMLNRLVEMTNADVAEPGVLLAWKPTVILADEGLEAPGLDLIFELQSANESLYWSLLDVSYQRCLWHLGKESNK
jgi:hypothetical protein